MQWSEEIVAVYAPQVVALELSETQRTLKEIASELGISLEKLTRVRASEAYSKAFTQAKRKAEQSVERITRENTLEIRQKLANYSGEAVETLVQLMRQGKDLRVKLSAACELIDRDGRFAKVSRLMNVDQGKDGAPMMPEDVSAEIMQALKSGMVQ